MKRKRSRTSQFEGGKDFGILHLYNEIPIWQQENEYLLSGYRPTSDSFLQCTWSLTLWHNETINIHSHILGCIFFGAAPWHFYHCVYSVYPDKSSTDLILFFMYLLGVSICFGCSARDHSSCHVLWNHSPSIASLGTQLDYAGIILLMWTASLPSIHYGFAEDKVARNFHWALTTLVASGCVWVTLHPRFRSPCFRPYRAIMYTGLGLSALFSVFHGLWLYGFAVQRRRVALDWMLLVAVFNSLGTAAYASRFPERWWPHRFDFVGASHQIFHVMVLLAGAAHYIGLIQSFHEARHASTAHSTRPSQSRSP
ncbi:mPR-like GPCR protein [Viridothelium virens]|uniref:MPR-like GPCR protein n=1 Tax=Viridothelium virens TaxID=1048519 RepID=A0A6A6HJS9_VIRVR|nr:mPR-like GPCR protein [Viridothelium virens]